MVFIQSKNNLAFKHALKLATHRRARLKMGETLLDGPHLVAAWLDAKRPIEVIWTTPTSQFCEEVVQLQARAQAPCMLLDETLFSELTTLPSQTGLLGQVCIPPAPAVRNDGFCLLLDGIQDPGNVGSILRTAVAVGVNQVLLSPTCADIWSPKVLRAGMGAQAVLNVIEQVNLHAFVKNFQGRVAVTSLQTSVSIFEADLRGSLALVLGSEGMGVSKELAMQADMALKIPMVGQIESLNVAAAAAIFLFEKVRSEGMSARQIQSIKQSKRST